MKIISLLFLLLPLSVFAETTDFSGTYICEDKDSNIINKVVLKDSQPLYPMTFVSYFSNGKVFTELNGLAHKQKDGFGTTFSLTGDLITYYLGISDSGRIFMKNSKDLNCFKQ